MQSCGHDKKFLSKTDWKDNGGSGTKDITTGYDAVRIIQNDDGLFIKANDATFSRSSCNHCGDAPFQPYTMSADCNQQWTTSTGDLRRTSMKFSAAVLPYFSHGYDSAGNAVLSSNNQVLTVTSKGTLIHMNHHDADGKMAVLKFYF